MDSISKSAKVITFCVVSFCSCSSQPPRQGNLTSLAVAARDRDNLIKTPKPKYGWPMMRILKLAKYRLKAQVEKGEGPSGEE